MVEIVEGRYYKTRDGRRVGPMRKVGYGWVADSGRIMSSDYIDWYNKGNYHYYNETSHDLIEEFKDDKPAYLYYDLSIPIGRGKFSFDGSDGTLDTSFTIEPHDMKILGGYQIKNVGSTPIFLASESGWSAEEAKPSSPVQSRKTLVPGVYGRVKIGDTGLRNDEQTVSVFLNNYHTASELREMIRVLGDIVEFLEEGSK